MAMTEESSRARLAEIESLFEREQAEHPPLHGPDDVPGTVDAVTLEWLTAVLCRDVPGAEVVGVEHGSQYDGTTSGRRLALSYNETGQAAALPERCYAKYSPTLQARLFVGLNGASAGEVAFYDELRPGLDLEAPRCYYAGFDQRSCRTFFLLEDLAQTKGAKFGTAVDLQVDRRMAESMVAQMAVYHGAFWGHERHPAHPYRTARVFQEDFNVTLNFDHTCRAGFDFAKSVMPAGIYECRDDFHSGLMRSLKIAEQATSTLLHQDTHLGNWYVLPDGGMGLVDWQCIVTGQWALDVAYALSIALAVEDRRAWERELLQLYLDRLAEHGGHAPAFDDAWLAYRRQMFHGLAFWAATYGWGENRPVPADICEVNVARTAQAMADLDSFDAIHM